MNSTIIRTGTILTAALLVIGASLTFSHVAPTPVAKVQADNNANSPIGPWFMLAQGAPFPTHVITFHSDGTMEIDNPEAGDLSTSDSIGIGPWAFDKHDHNTINGKFVEINADRTTGQYVSKLIVTYTLKIKGNTFTGPAEATYYNPDGSYKAGPLPATLSATRITLP